MGVGPSGNTTRLSNISGGQQSGRILLAPAREFHSSSATASVKSLLAVRRVKMFFSLPPQNLHKYRV